MGALQIMISRQRCVAIILAILLVTHGTCGRQNVGAFVAQQALPQEFMDEMITDGEEALYSELKKHQHIQSNSKWPALRDLLLTADYDNALDSNENANERFLERLSQFAATGVDLEGEEEANQERINILGAENIALPMLIKKLTAAEPPEPKVNFKDRGTKKNIQFRQYYMSPCHFKICNMGRKRNARTFFH